MNERDRALAEAVALADGYVPEDQRRERRLASDVAAGIADLIRSKMIHAYDLRAPMNSDAWGIGHHLENGRFTVRRVVWGKLMAQSEKRKGEKIVPLVLLERRKPK